MNECHTPIVEDIKRDAEHLFDDVVEEYCSISSILQRFREWRERAVRSYGQAYIPMCLPQLLAPLIRLQMLTWNPLEVSSRDFNAFLEYCSGSISMGCKFWLKC